MTALSEAEIAMPSNISSRSIFEQPRSVLRTVTPWELLVWTYRDQQAHRYLCRPGDYWAYVVDLTGLAGADAPRPKLHADAAMVHMAVIDTLAPRSGDLNIASLIHHAAKGVAPEPSDLKLSVEHITPDRRTDRYSWEVVKGKRVDHLLEVVETFTEERQVWRRAGKGRRVCSVETVTVEIEVCPIKYWPDPAWLLMVDQIHQDFRRQLDQVTARLRDLKLKRHVLAD